MRLARLGLVWLGGTAACGGSSFHIAKTAYAATTSAALYTQDAHSGVDVTLKSDPNAHTPDDEVAVRVTLLWPANAPPPVGRDIALAAPYQALVALACTCSGVVEPMLPPAVTGKFHLESLSAAKVVGSFQLTFSGALPLVAGGVAYENTTLQATAGEFTATSN